MKKRIVYCLAIIAIIIIYTLIDIMLSISQIETAIKADINSIKNELCFWHKYNPAYGITIDRKNYLEITGISLIGVVSIGFVDTLSDAKDDTSGNGKIDFCDYRIIPWTNLITIYLDYEIEIYRYIAVNKSFVRSFILDGEAVNYEQGKFNFTKLNRKNELYAK